MSGCVDEVLFLMLAGIVVLDVKKGSDPFNYSLFLIIFLSRARLSLRSETSNASIKKIIHMHA